MRTKTLLIVITFAWFSSFAQAMDMKMEGRMLVASGRVVPEDIAQFDALFNDAHPKTLLLRNSKGGDLKAGYAIADRLRDSGMSTLVEGYCESSCAVIFMGGVSRQVSSGAPLEKTTLRFHGPHNKKTKEVNEKGFPRLYNWLMEKSGNRFNPDLLHRAVYISNEHDMTWFYHPSQAINNVTVWFCANGVKHKPVDCDPIANVDALSQGVLTSSEIVDPSLIASN